MDWAKPIRWNVQRGLVAPKWRFYWDPEPLIALPFWAGGGDPRNYGENTVTGAVENAPVWAVGAAGRGFSFGGVDDRINFNDPAVIDDAYPFTLVAHFLYRAHHATASQIHGKQEAGFADGAWAWRAKSDGSLTFLVANSGTNMEVLTNELLSPGIIYELVLTWPGTVTASDVHIYINGIEATYATQTDATTIDSDAAIAWYLAARDGGGGSDFGLDALMFSASAHPGIWSTGQVERYHDDPFGPFRPDLRIIGKAAAAVGTNPKGPLGHPFHGPFAGPIAA